MVGIITGFNLRVIQYVWTISDIETIPNKVKNEKVQTTPYLNGLVPQVTPSVSNEFAGKNTTPIGYESTPEILGSGDTTRTRKYATSQIRSSPNMLSLGSSNFDYEDDDGYYRVKQREKSSIPTETVPYLVERHILSRLKKTVILKQMRSSSLTRN